MPGQEQAIHEDAVKPQISEAQVGRLFSESANEEVFNQILEQSPEGHLPELTAAYFLRAHTMGGQAPPTELPAEHPLYQQIVSLNLETVEDPVQKQVFGVLQSTLMNPVEKTEMERTKEVSALAEMLVPGLIKKYGFEASAAIYNIASRDMMRFGSLSPRHAINHANIVKAVVEKLGDKVPDSDSTEAFARLTMAENASSSVEAFVSSTSGALAPTERQEFTNMSAILHGARINILRNDMGLSPEISEVAETLIQEDEGIPELLKDEYQFRTITRALRLPSVRQLITSINTQYPACDIRPSTIKEILSGNVNTEDYDRRATDLSSKDTIDIAKSLEEMKFVQQAFIGCVISAEDSAEYRRSLEVAMANPGIKGTIVNGIQTTHEDANRPWEEVGLDLVRDPNKVMALFAALEKSGLDQKLLQTPSAALPTILHELAGSNDPELAVAAGTSIIGDSYAQASKLSDPILINHYRLRISAYLKDLKVISSDPDVLKHYKEYVATTQTSSNKQQSRAARVFKAVTAFGPIEIKPGDTIDAIEAKVVDSFLTKLINDEVDFSSDETARLVEAFGEVAPLFTYAQQQIGKPAWKQALGELTKAVASGNYSQWRRGDGSPEALASMKQAGYLPANLTLQQYQEWISDSSYSSEEELISSAEDTALAIREALKQASVDIDMLAPGYTIDAASLEEVVGVRNGLGRMTGLLHKAMKQSEGKSLEQSSVDQIHASLGEFAESSEVQNLLGLLKNGTDPNEVSDYLNTTREHIDQLRLLIRIANISSEEVAAGALLSEQDEHGKRKDQEQLFETLNRLKLELPEELMFIPDTALSLLADHAQENGQREIFSVEDTVDPQVTIEIGETPQRSCQHYETGGHNSGLIGYFGPEVKIAIVRNAKGGIIARVITRLMEDENGDPVLYSEPIYQSVSSSKVKEMIGTHLNKKAAKMGIEHRGSMSDSRTNGRKQLAVKTLKMPAVYSDAGGGLREGSLAISA